MGSQVGKKRIRNIKNEYFYPSSKQTIAVKIKMKTIALLPMKAHSERKWKELQKFSW